MHATFSRPDYYEASAPPDSLQSATDLPTDDWMPVGRATADGSHVHQKSIDEGGAHLYPDSIATATPQAFTVASPPDHRNRLRSWPARQKKTNQPRTAHRPISVRFEPALDLRGFKQRFLTYAFPSLLAGPGPSDSPNPSRTSSEAAPALPGVPRTRLPPSFIGQLRLTNGGVLSPPLDSSRLVAHERLPVVTGRLHHHQTHLFVDQMFPQRQDCVRCRGPRPHRLHGFAATPAGDADADLRVPLGHIHPRTTAVHDFHDQLPPSAEPSNRSTRGGPRQFGSLTLVLKATIHGSRGDPPRHADKQAHRHHRGNGDHRDEHSDSPPGLPAVASHQRTQPEGQSPGHPDPPAQAATRC